MHRSHAASLAITVTLSSFACAPEQAPAPVAPVEAARDTSVLDAAAQRAVTPQQALEALEEGNRRFVEDRLTPRDYLAQAAATAGGQYPTTTFLGCLDSRVPPEIIFDQGIGDAFVGRVAGNVEDVNLLGSLEFATEAAGSKVIVVLGHTECGAIKGAADQVELGNLTQLLNEFEAPLARAAAATEGDANSSNKAFINLAIEENVRQTIADILDRSAVISARVASGELLLVGAVYDLSTGRVNWLD